MRILGITGGIATGKSSVTALLAEQGAPTLSADNIARDMLLPGTVITRGVLDAFPECADPDSSDTIDRAALSRRIFADPAARHTLDKLTHPPIVEALRTAASKWRAESGGCAALEIPLLFEAGLETLVDMIVVVTCRAETQSLRLRIRSNIDAWEARRQIQAQWPLEEKMKRAHCVIDTNETWEDTRRQVEVLWKECCPGAHPI